MSDNATRKNMEVCNAQRGSSPRQEEAPSIHEGSGGSNPPCRIRLHLCKDSDEFALYRNIINTHHTYKQWRHTPGRKIAWLIEDRDSEMTIGAIGVSSAFMCLRPRDELIGWTRDEKQHNLRFVANNYRFALIERGIGSQALSILAREAKREWKRKYGDRLVLMESLVQPPYLGQSYKAAGWMYLGKTKGCAVRRLPFSLWKVAGGERQRLFESNPQAAIARYSRWNSGRVVTSQSTVPKLIFVRPLHRYWKRKLSRAF